MSKLTFAELFDAPAAPVQALPLETELRLIEAARTGDRDAYDALLRQYIPAVRGLVAAEQRRTDHRVDLDETRANVLAAFTEAVHSVKDGFPLVVALRAATVQVADEYHIVKAVTVPPRTRRRFLALVREAGGDFRAAAQRVVDDPKGTHMTLDVFQACREAMADWGSLEGITEDYNAPFSSNYTVYLGGVDDTAPSMSPISHERGYATVDQKADVDRAFAAVDDDGREVCKLAYGFADYDPQPDAEVAHRLGYSRSKVQRIRMSALAQMHDALCHGDDPRCDRPEAHGATA